MFFGREDVIDRFNALLRKRVASLVTCRGRRRCSGPSFVGDISSATAPDSLFGVGRFSITPKGTLIMFR